MVRSIAAFMDACYIARRNAISAPALEHFQQSVKRFQDLRDIFIEAGVRTSISLPRQHALDHFYYAIHFFGSPNGLCSSITESKHIKAVKEPWRRSSRFQALIQMLRIIVRMDKMAALHCIFSDCGMLVGSTSSYVAGVRAKDEQELPIPTPNIALDEDDDDDDGGPELGTSSGALSVVTLAAKFRMFLLGHAPHATS